MLVLSSELLDIEIKRFENAILQNFLYFIDTPGSNKAVLFQVVYVDFNCNVDKKLVVNLIKKVQKKKAIVKALVFDSGNHTLLKGKSNTIIVISRIVL